MYRGPIHQIHQDTSRNAIHQKRYIYRGALLLERMPSCCLTTHKSCWQVNGLALGFSGSPFVHQLSAAQKHRSAARLLGKTADTALIFAACALFQALHSVALVSLTSSPTPSAPPHAPLSSKCHCLWSTHLPSFVTTVQLHSQNHRCGGALQSKTQLSLSLITQCLTL